MVESFYQTDPGPTPNTIAEPNKVNKWVAQQIAINCSAPALLNNFRSITSGDFHTNSTWERERADGTWLVPSDIHPPGDANITIRTSHVVNSQTELTCTNAIMMIESGGALIIDQ